MSKEGMRGRSGPRTGRNKRAPLLPLLAVVTALAVGLSVALLHRGDLVVSPAPSVAAGTAIRKPAVDIFALTSASADLGSISSLPLAVDGVSWVFRWRDIEKTRGSFDWSAVDAAIKDSAASGRKTMLRIDAGAFSPSWVPNQLTFAFKPLGPQPYLTITMPRTWDPTYIADWSEFIRAYGARYDDNSRLARIQMTGGGWQGEMALPQWQGWIAAGYTDAAMIKAWDTFIDLYRSAFPKHQSALDFGEPLQVYFHSHVEAAVLAYAATYGSEVTYQQNGLKGTTRESGQIFTTLLKLSSAHTVGWQMWGGNGSSGNLRQAFLTALHSHASYIEVYLNDCLNATNGSSLTYLATGGMTG